MAPIVATMKAVWKDILLIAGLLSTFGCSFRLVLSPGFLNKYIGILENHSEKISCSSGWRDSPS